LWKNKFVVFSLFPYRRKGGDMDINLAVA